MGQGRRGMEQGTGDRGHGTGGMEQDIGDRDWVRAVGCGVKGRGYGKNNGGQEKDEAFEVGDESKRMEGNGLEGDKEQKTGR